MTFRRGCWTATTTDVCSAPRRCSFRARAHGRTGAWEAMQKALKAQFEPGVFGHLAGDTSAPFYAGEQRQVSVKVIDDRGNELVVVKGLG